MSARRAEVDIRPLLAKLRKVPGALERELKPLVLQEARLFISGSASSPGMAQVTPPASKGVIGSKAKKQGEAAVARDIGRIYATAARVYDELVSVDRAAASAFWLLYSEGSFSEAGEIMRMLAGRAFLSTRSFAAFDGGTMHKRFRGKQGRVSRSRVMMVVTNPNDLQAYVRKIQGRVGLLASGWAAAAARLGAKLPAWVTRHGTRNGALGFEIGPDKYVIVMTNKVKYHRAVDLQRRVNAVQAYRAKALKRRMPYVLRAALRKAGFSSSGGLRRAA